MSTPIPIQMPQLGESVTEGTIARWLKHEGDHVERDEPIAEIITDKVNDEFPSPHTGTLVELLAAEGDTIPVGGEIARIEVASPVAAAAGKAGNSAASPPEIAANPATLNGAASDAPSRSRDEREEIGEHRRYTPVVKRLAQEHDVDLAAVDGTGLSGRVTKNDVLAYIEQRKAGQAAQVQATQATAAPAQEVAPAAPPAPAAALKPAAPAPAREAPPAAPQPAAPVAATARELGPDEELLPLTPMRRAIAEHMVRSVHTAPHAALTMEVDLTRLVRWRERNKEAFKKRNGVDVTYVSFIIQAVVDALKAFPIVNSSWGDDGIILKKRINIGLAVGTDDALVVPVIRDADEKSLVGIARAVADLAARARDNRLTPSDMGGGTFTVNNVGAFGVVDSAPVINQPQAAILAMNAIVKRPIVLDDDAIAVRSMMNLSMSIDHRIIDGLSAGRFLQRVVENVGKVEPGNL